MTTAPRFFLSPSLAAKIGSLIVHVEESLSAKGHAVDFAAARSLIDDADVQRWLATLRKAGFLPVKR